jgi:hypothetical protein
VQGDLVEGPVVQLRRHDAVLQEERLQRDQEVADSVSGSGEELEPGEGWPAPGSKGPSSGTAPQTVANTNGSKSPQPRKGRLIPGPPAVPIGRDVLGGVELPPRRQPQLQARGHVLLLAQALREIVEDDLQLLLGLVGGFLGAAVVEAAGDAGDGPWAAPATEDRVT